mgnify:FL=1
MIPDDRTSERATVHWARLVLHFADGSGLISTWDEARGCAIQRDGARHMAEASADAEHLRALAELRETGGATNWVVSLSAGAVDPPPLEAIDWSGFEAPDPEW